MMMAIQASGGWAAVQWGAVLTLVLLIGALSLVLLRSKLGRTPAPFATTDDLLNDKNEILGKLETVQAKLAEMASDMREQDDDFKKRCATVDQLNGMGGRVATVEAAMAEARGESAEARRQSDRTAQELAHVRQELSRVEAGMAVLSGEVRPIAAGIAEVKGQLELLLRHFTSQRP